ncbi:hypothetical protein [Mucilaginibacter sp.]|uniref:hypothetical protein n=1 Tax=Mucilaginibacter sp. TaxID=1882438 RepID=UPI0025D170D1|nr:hypothetical protein [Mucilaginibacter sp.]
MKLINLIPYLKSANGIAELFKLNNLNIKSEVILIYMIEFLTIDSEIVLFEIEETEDDLLFQKNGISYIQLFPVNYAKELIEDFSRLGYDDDLKIARRLLEYRINDA